MNQFNAGNPITPDIHIITKIGEEEMQEVYNWVDEIPLSRPKKNIARDFSDCGKYINFLWSNIQMHYISFDRRSAQALFATACWATQLLQCPLYSTKELQLEYS